MNSTDQVAKGLNLIRPVAVLVVVVTALFLGCNADTVESQHEPATSAVDNSGDQANGPLNDREEPTASPKSNAAAEETSVSSSEAAEDTLDTRSLPERIEDLRQEIQLAKDRDSELELRERLIDLLANMRLFEQLRDEAARVLRLDANNAVGLRGQAIASYLNYRANSAEAPSLDEIVAQFHKAIEHNPSNLRLAAVLAHIYRHDLEQPSQTERNALADQVVDHLVESDPNNAELYLARFYYRETNDVPGAQSDLRKALDLGTDSFVINITAGANLLKLGRRATKEKRFEDERFYLQEAINHYQQAIQLEPNDPQGYLGLGQTYLVQNKAGLVIETWREGLTHNPGNIDLNARMTSVLLALDRTDECKALLESLEAIVKQRAPKLSDSARIASRAAIAFLWGKYHAGKGDHQKAIESLQQAIGGHRSLDQTARVVAEYLEALWLLGVSHEALGNYAEAAEHFDRTVKVDADWIRSDAARARAAQNRKRAGESNPEVQPE